MASIVPTRVAFKNILFATDFSDSSRRALLHALAMAKRFDAKLTVVHTAPPEAVTPIPMEPLPLEVDWQKKRAAESLARLEDFEPLHMYPHEIILRQGNPWLEMSGIIDDKGIDLVVLGTHGRGVLGTMLLGSVAEQVLRHAKCPVLTVGPGVSPSVVDHEPLSHILFATDFSEASLRAFPYALSLAQENNAELTLMHVLEQLRPMPGDYSNELLGDYRKRLSKLVPEDANLWCKPQVLVDVGVAAETIIRTAHDRLVDLIVMGAHPGGLVASHLAWTVVHSVVRHARCPVLTTRS
jgi:nucleotide-binding universal stress UspA family protein